MMILNYSHPLTEPQLARLRDLSGQPGEEKKIPTQVAEGESVQDAAHRLADAAGLAPGEWQTEPLLLLLPGLASLAACLIAEVHGRAGYFPSIVVLRPAPSTGGPLLFEVSEVISLQTLRDKARSLR